MEDTNQQQPAQEKKYRFHYHDPSRPLSEQRIIWDEEAKKKFRELPFSLGLGFKIDLVKLCNGGYEWEDDDE